MGGIDLDDHKNTINNCERKTSKWWCEIFHRHLKMAVVNACYLFKDSVPSKAFHRVPDSSNRTDDGYW